MGTKDLLKHCKYYKGGDTCPFTDNDGSMFWFYEKAWVISMSSDSPTLLLDEYIDDYIRVGLRNFIDMDDTPLSLKALLFNRFCKWSGGSQSECVGAFKKFYIYDYLKGVIRRR